MIQQGITQMSERKATSTSQAPSTEPIMIPSSWYLGGNHDAKLLTSVDGDLDPTVLNKVTAVPKDVGEIALSVESMVSHDYIVGDFETDLLAKIATNTLVPKRPNLVETPTNRAKTTPITKKAPQTQIPKPISEVLPQSFIAPQRSPSMESFSVPNPLADSSYKPVPNPLAVPITPPDSPVSVTVPIPVTISLGFSRKRKSPTIPDIAPQSKKAARREVQVTVVGARQQ